MIFDHYEGSQHKDPDGRPSRRDRRYWKVKLSLKEDFSFTLTKQRGRLEVIALEEKKGTWKLQNDRNQLELHITEVKNTNKYMDGLGAKKLTTSSMKWLRFKGTNLIYEGGVTLTLHPYGNQINVRRKK